MFGVVDWPGNITRVPMGAACGTSTGRVGVWAIGVTVVGAVLVAMGLFHPLPGF
jgi:hypothetical protein